MLSLKRFNILLLEQNVLLEPLFLINIIQASGVAMILGKTAEADSLLLFRVLDFLTTYSWVFSFKWVELLSFPGDHRRDPVLRCPPDWQAVLAVSDLPILQGIVLGKQLPLDWPESFREFVTRCLTLTQALIDVASRSLPSEGRLDCPVAPVCGHLVVHSNPGLLTYHSAPTPVTLAKHVRVKAKKQYEIEITSAFICDFLMDNFRLASAGYLDSPPDGCRTFQTLEFQVSPELCRAPECPRGSSPALSRKQRFNGLVDVGSGLGHLPSHVLRRLVSVGDARKVDLRVIAVEADEAIHAKAEAIEARKPDGASRIRRECFRVSCANLDGLRCRLQTHLISLPSPSYLLCGLHCCGDLTNDVMQLFLDDPSAQGLLILGCCYHKMTPCTFPASNLLRSAVSLQPQNCLTEITDPVALRLACQWSPLQWCTWSPQQLQEHRVRVFTRCLIEIFFNPESKKHCTRLRRAVSVDPIASIRWPAEADLTRVEQAMPDSLAQYWARLGDLDRCQETALKLQCLASTNRAMRLWRLLPGLITLQQLMQPLLEALILTDRVLSLREHSSFIEFATAIRLYDPRFSPRCMALVARKL